MYSHFALMGRDAPMPADSNQTHTKMLATWFEVREWSIKDGMSSNQFVGEAEDQLVPSLYTIIVTTTRVSLCNNNKVSDRLILLYSSNLN